MPNNVKLNYLVTCDSVLFDAANKASIIGIFDKIFSKGVPAVHNKFSVVVNTIGSPGTSYDERIEIINTQDNNPIVSLQGKISFEESGRNNFLGNFVNTVFPNFGKYRIKVSIDGQEITNQNEHYVLVEPTPQGF